MCCLQGEKGKTYITVLVLAHSGLPAKVAVHSVILLSKSHADGARGSCVNDQDLQKNNIRRRRGSGSGSEPSRAPHLKIDNFVGLWLDRFMCYGSCSTARPVKFEATATEELNARPGPPTYRHSAGWQRYRVVCLHLQLSFGAPNVSGVPGARTLARDESPSQPLSITADTAQEGRSGDAAVAASEKPRVAPAKRSNTTRRRTWEGR